MDRAEAQQLLAARIAELRSETYESLVARRDQHNDRPRVAASGKEYQVDTVIFWDGGPPNLRVLVTVDDGGSSAIYSRVRDGFIRAPDGSFIDE
jgi:hypothetical protein